MKLIVAKDKKNSKDKKFKDGINTKTFSKIILGDPKSPGGSIHDIKPGDPIIFGSPWVTYQFNKAIANPADRESYEWFCCGYLFYYDEITRNGAVDHGIHFDWENDARVSIYLYPGPDSSKSMYKNLHPSNDPQKDYHRNAEDNYLAPGSGGIDPQPPPPPPPPDAMD